MAFYYCISTLEIGFLGATCQVSERCLRKGIELKRLTLDQFIVTLSEAETVVNTQPLTYVYEEFESGFSLTPAHFLDSNLRCFPLIDAEIDYFPSEDSMTTLLNKWKKGQRDMWRNEYLASLKEASPYHKTLKNQMRYFPMFPRPLNMSGNST